MVYGADDHVALPRFGERLAQQMPDARFVSLPRTGHFPMIESATATRTLVRAFLNQGSVDQGRPDPEGPDVAPQQRGAP